MRRREFMMGLPAVAACAAAAPRTAEKTITVETTEPSGLVEKWPHIKMLVDAKTNSLSFVIDSAQPDRITRIRLDDVLDVLRAAKRI